MKLHLYAGPSFHSDGFIVGDREALMLLRNALNEVLDAEQTVSKAKVFTSDGEGYDVFVIRREDNATWDKLALPYTAEKNLPNDDGQWPCGPHELL